MAKGDVLLITFPFTNLRGSKLRPAVILAETPLYVTICFITSQTKSQENFDIPVEPSIENGLKKNSLIRLSKLTTLDKVFAKGLLGNLNDVELKQLNAGLIDWLQLNTTKKAS